ncbi:MAG: hypothetical protein COX29_03485 [Candidatus Moranbacteria bacterium CG23_combo_of_CG06-09_8_20_14_all_35_22]|nr:MAG: hypothetical protein COX29_03485 [Candidatus Moranbacteria bacterium CG23_combo_of_CG06-09_8_20_14_all_35_22]
MFGFNSAGSNDPKNKNQGQIDNEPMNLSEDNFKLDDFPIHTMKNDLEKLKNPASVKITFEQNNPVKKISSQQGGPFFSKETSQNRPLSQKEISPIKKEPDIYIPKIAQSKKETLYFDEAKELPKEIIKEKKPSVKQEPKQSAPSPETHGIGKAVAIALVIFILLIAGAGGYYFWMTRMISPSDQNIPLDEPETILPEETQPTSVLSSKNSNYLQINLTQTNPEELKKVLNNYAEEVSKTNEISVFKFLLTDETNAPIAFQDFSTALEINLSPETSAQIGQDFTFYIYNYGDKTRFGLILTSLEDNLLKNALLKEEETLFSNLAPLYPSLTSPTNTTFSPITYKNYAVRYLNITSVEDYTIDYAISNNKLFIGTTRTTLFSALDQLSE